jgi:beta-glucanase (GH16 family)
MTTRPQFVTTLPRHSLALLLLLPAWVATAAPVSVGPLVWREEFSGTSLNNDKWKVIRPGLQWDEKYYNDPKAITVGDGVAKITTFSKGKTVHSGVIATRREFTYGYFEARLRFHDASGTFSAFWLLRDPPKEPESIEIDVAEHRFVDDAGNDVSHLYTTALHKGDEKPGDDRIGGDWAVPNLGNDTWNKYGLLWTKTGYKFYKDDNPMPVWETTQLPSNLANQILLSSLASPEPDDPDTPEVEVSWAGSVPPEGYGTRHSSTTVFQVDYVRVHSLAADANLDGQVDASDLSALAAHYRSRGDFSAGDFNGDGVVDVGDVRVLDDNFGVGTGGGDVDLAKALAVYPQLAADYAALPGVPEPSILPIIMSAATLLARRRRRERDRQADGLSN